MAGSVDGLWASTQGNQYQHPVRSSSPARAKSSPIFVDNVHSIANEFMSIEGSRRSTVPIVESFRSAKDGDPSGIVYVTAYCTSGIVLPKT